MRKILALLGALIVAAALTLVGSAPAQAYGWSAQRCMTQTGNGAKVCVQFYTVPSGNGQKVNQIYLCATKVDNTYGNRFTGTKDSGATYIGSAGNVLGGSSIVDVGATWGGNCALTTTTNRPQLGNGACFRVDGTLDLSAFPDASYSISGKVLGGAC